MNKISESKRLFYNKRIGLFLILVLLAVLVALPVFAGGYVLHILTNIFILGLFSYSVNLLLGYTGLLSFGQAGFFAIGAYACAKFLLTFPQYPLLGIFGGAVVAVVASFLLGFLCVRHTAIYFAMLTLAVGMGVYSLIRKIKWLGGGYGLPDLHMGSFLGIRLDLIENYYYFVLIITVLALFLFYRLVRSPLGLTFQAIRDAESRVAFTGISVRNQRLLCFVIAGAYAGLAGALRAGLYNSVYPLLSHWSTSAEPVIATLLGGMYTFAGPMVGAAAFYGIKDIIFRVTDAAWQLPLGILVLALVMGLRGGIVGSIEQSLVPWLKRRFRNERN
jgi:branched-chain amino acid transport system permease protein